MRFRVCVTVDITPLEHQTFVDADNADDARNLAVAEAEQLVNSVSLDTSYHAWQCEEVDAEDEARIRAEDGADEGEE